MKSIVITGGTGDLGSIVVPRLATDYRCAVVYRSEESRKRLAESDRVVAVPDGGDVAAFAPVYGLVLLAGGFAGGSTAADVERMLEVNLLSAVRAIDAVRPHLASPGRIIAISSAASLAKPAGLAAYTAAKAALNAYVETLAKDLKEKAVTVNALLPTALDTGGKRSTTERLVKRENVAEMIALLLSDQASNVSGQLIAMSA
ncbi:MAG TPA: SDR family NAD(P)-dependent oxidoreductase [Thermoanaerobaculia bacterium]|nr:SDR family NAD(P)-dependent oxidoreductase [Thermoanaerobaculia bacterium]